MTSPLGNLDLLSVGLAIAGIGILGFMVFFGDRKSLTNRMFLFFSVITIIWGIVNYLDYQVSSPIWVLWLLRFEIFFAVWHAFSFFQLFYVFPKTQLTFPKWYKLGLIPLVIVTSLINLSPLVFPSIAQLSTTGTVSKTVVGPGIYLFILIVVGLIIASIYLMIKKLRHAQGVEQAQFKFLLIGAIITFTLLITFNLVLPALFLNVRFIPLGAVFIFPFIAFTAYAIFKHHLLNTKVIATEILAFTLIVITFSEIVISQSLVETLFRVGEFIAISIIGIFLIKSVLKEVQQREELERLNKQIEAQNAQLQDLSRFKSQLLSLASHQIKSPLAAIKGFVSLIADGSYGEVGEPVKETLKKVQGSADDLIGLINTLLDVRKVEEGKMEYKFERVDIAGMIAKLVDLLQPLAAAKKLSLTFEGGDAAGTHKPVWVTADPEKLKQVVQNLVDNAIKYTPTGFVKVILTENPPAAAGGQATTTVSVSDSGLGVAAELIPHLFEEFVRDERVKKEIRGTGLGLYIARKIAEAHGGTINAESPGEGKGSTFRLNIPEMLSTG